MKCAVAEITVFMSLTTAKTTVVTWNIAERSSMTEDAVGTTPAEITEKIIAAT
jgi:hypothetical protein